MAKSLWIVGKNHAKVGAWRRFLGLHVVATPIGNQSDLSPRAIEIIRESEFIIGEELKPTTHLLKSHQLTPKKIKKLNEHSDPEDLKELVELCRDHEVALVSDCGTPGFCDPGADLVKLCRQQNIKVSSVPGPSSIATFLSLSGHRMDEFLFKGFLPAKEPSRSQSIKDLKKQNIPCLLMDTPYRLKRLLEELAKFLPENNIVLGLNLSMDNELVLEGRADNILKQLPFEKAEFFLALMPLKKKKIKRN